jgi:hypothetical protein
MSDQSREQFEAAIAEEAGQPLVAIQLSRLGDSYATSALIYAWWAWQKSPTMLVIELPPVPVEPEAPEDGIDDSHLDAYHAAIGMRHACANFIEAMNLKVKS